MLLGIKKPSTLTPDCGEYICATIIGMIGPVNTGTTTPTDARVTEDGQTRVTEDGQTRITEN